VDAPARPLGQGGLALWDAALANGAPAGEELLFLCEQVDERMALRMRVLRDADPDDRKALRQLEQRVAHALRRLALDPASARVRAALDLDLGRIEDRTGREALIAAAQAIALGLDSSTAEGDHHAAVFLVRELRSLHAGLLGTVAGPDPFDDFLERMSSPLGDAP